MSNNCEPISDPKTESSDRPYKPGHYYNGNKTEKGGYKLGGEGSLGLAYDQGALRCSEIPEFENLHIAKDNSIYTVPEGKQGSAAHLKAPPSNSQA